MDTLNSFSALQRMKVQYGLAVRERNGVSAYIAMCKIKKTLIKEFTPELQERHANRLGRKQTEVVVERLIERLNKLPNSSLKALYSTLERKGLDALVIELTKPMAQLMKAKYGES